MSKPTHSQRKYTLPRRLLTAIANSILHLQKDPLERQNAFRAYTHSRLKRLQPQPPTRLIPDELASGGTNSRGTPQFQSKINSGIAVDEQFLQFSRD
ncbi:hypothetical protein IFO70_30805 [Phormidium tenue FACHB-886]|nr:hypothetical protein [Phormidium tenue FACHB-886]